jgi:type VI protein secretion system component VasK
LSNRSNTFRWIAFLLWVALIACSLWFAATTPKAGDGFTRGLNRVIVFVQWQAVAFVVALFAAARGRRERPTATGSRILAYLPMFTQLVLAGALVTLVVVTRVFKF